MCTWAEIIWCVPLHCVQSNANGYFHGKRVVSKKVMRVALQGELQFNFTESNGRHLVQLDRRCSHGRGSSNA